MSTILACIFVLFVFNVSLTKGISEEAYFVLSEKIEAVNSEVRYLRNELKSTKRELHLTNARLEQLDHVKKRNEDIRNKTMSKENGSDIKEQRSTALENTCESNNAMTIVRKAWKNEKMIIRNFWNQINRLLSECQSDIENVTADLQDYTYALSLLQQDTGRKHTETTERIQTLESSMEDLADQYNTELAKLQSEIDDNTHIVSVLQSQLASASDQSQQSLASLREQLSKKVNNIHKTLAQTESCQSGNNVGAHRAPQSPFPYTVTVRFNPPFKNVPAFVYGTKLLDVGGHVRYNVIIDRLTRQSFTLSIRSWATTVLTGVKVSWMACPN